MRPACTAASNAHFGTCYTRNSTGTCSIKATIWPAQSKLHQGYPHPSRSIITRNRPKTKINFKIEFEAIKIRVGGDFVFLKF